MTRRAAVAAGSRTPSARTSTASARAAISSRSLRPLTIFFALWRLMVRPLPWAIGIAGTLMVFAALFTSTPA